MRPIEKRLAAVEAKMVPAASARPLVFIPPRGLTDYEAWRRECRKKAAGANLAFVRFVSPGDVLHDGLVVH